MTRTDRCCTFVVSIAHYRRIAHAAGIKVFVTGGIGGVHRFCEETMGANLLTCYQLLP